jgi:hypothetical protein
MTNIVTMVDQLGIDVGCQVTPRFDLFFACVLRSCFCCAAREACIGVRNGGLSLGTSQLN